MEFVKCAQGVFKLCHDGFTYLISLFFLLNYFSVTFKLLAVYMLYIFFVAKSIHLDICYLVTNVYD